jgi:hypothetical protein
MSMPASWEKRERDIETGDVARAVSVDAPWVEWMVRRLEVPESGGSELCLELFVEVRCVERMAASIVSDERVMSTLLGC